MRPKTIDNIHEHRIKFIIIVQQLITHLCIYEHLLQYIKLPTLVKIFKLDELPWEEIPLNKEEIIGIIKEVKDKIHKPKKS